MQLKPLILRFKRLVSEVSLPTILTLSLAHATASFWGLKALSEEGITSSVSEFIYWYLVSCSTVGYGDLSPSTNEGKIFTVFFILTIGLSLFAMVLGKLANLFIEGRTKLMNGKRDFSYLENHIIIVGYEPRKTNRIVELILADEHRTKRFILIASDDGHTHPYPDEPDIGYVNLDDYTSVISMEKMAISKADKIIVCGENDAESFKLSVHYATIIKESGYITTHISDEDIATTLRGLNSPIEVTTPHRSEQLVKAMQDNGTSMLFNQLLTNGFEQTTYIIESTNIVRSTSGVPGIINFGKLKSILSDELGIMLVGVSADRLGKNLKINPANDFEINMGKFLFYISAKRICQSDIDKLFSSKTERNG
tara:strand:- start:355 stop:1455 length:1101 start_codon:yes stop_codon:yes gene_type:complete